MKTKMFVTLIVFLFSISTATGQDLKIKFMSFNVQQPYNTDWDSRKAAMASLINNESCDVIGTQEARVEMRDYLLQNISGYAAFGECRDGGDAGEASYIFYKTAKYDLDASHSGNFWLSNTPTTPSRFGGDYNRICTYARLVEKSSGNGFYLFNIHNYLVGETSYRLAAAKLLIQKVLAREIDDPVYITGDFNSPENDQITIWMKSGSDNNHKCRDTYRDYDPTGDVTTGFGTKFDYIYCPTELKYTTTSSYVVNSPSCSDHMPIVANVEYSSNSTPPQIVLSQTTKIHEGSENGKTITVSLLNAQFVTTLHASNWTLSNLPDGVTKGSVVRNGTTQATITLQGNSTIGSYQDNISDVTVTVAVEELVNGTSDVSADSGIVFLKHQEIQPGVAWHSYDIIMKNGSPQATVTADNVSADMEFYESTNNAGVSKGTLFANYTSGNHAEAFNHVSKFWSSASYPYAGLSTVARGNDYGESNTPEPRNVYDLTMHPPSNSHLTVAAFVVPQNGNYSISNLSARRVSTNGDSAAFIVFNSQKIVTATLTAANDQAWVTDDASYLLNNLKADDRIYFAVGNADDFANDATEISWTITFNGADDSRNLFNGHDPAYTLAPRVSVNSVGNQFIVNNIADAQMLRMYDSFGRLVEEHAVSHRSMIPIGEHVAAGMYLVTVIGAKERQTIRIIKK
jgi:endonuclease/exonuclease/phosphatase family metal-dependent hydrolase